MPRIKEILTSQYVLWIILFIPAIGMLNGFFSGNAEYGMLMHVTGEFAGRFLVISLIATPLLMLFPNGVVTKWLVRNRRYFGVAAFSYTLLHTIFYLLEESFAHIVNEFFRVGMITGWIAFFIFIPLASTSTNSAIKRMGRNWKRLQRWVYLAGVMAFLHWALVITDQAHWTPAIVHFAPVFILSLYRLWYLFLKPKAAVSIS